MLPPPERMGSPNPPVHTFSQQIPCPWLTRQAWRSHGHAVSRPAIGPTATTLPAMSTSAFRGTSDYIASPDLQAAVNVAVSLERP